MPDSADSAATYNGHVLRWFADSERAGSITEPGAVSGEAGSKAQGAQVRFWLACRGDRVRRAAYEAYGCPHVLAAAAYLANWSEGRSIEELGTWSWRALADFLAAPVEKWGKFLILEDALKAAARAAGYVV